MKLKCLYEKIELSVLKCLCEIENFSFYISPYDTYDDEKRKGLLECRERENE